MDAMLTLFDPIQVRVLSLHVFYRSLLDCINERWRLC